MNKIIYVLEKAERWVIVSAFSIMVIAYAVQVFNRNITQVPLPWLEEIAVYCMIFLVMLATEAGLRDGSQISVTAVVEKLPGRIHLAVQALAKLVVVLFSAIMFVTAINLVQSQMKYGQTSAALKMPMWVPYTAFVVSFAAIFCVQAVALYRLVRGFVTNDISMVASTSSAEEGEIEALVEEFTADVKEDIQNTDQNSRRDGSR